MVFCSFSLMITGIPGISKFPWECSLRKERKKYADMVSVEIDDLVVCEVNKIAFLAKS